MGSMHAEGWGGVKQNYVESTKWFMLAARQVTRRAAPRHASPSSAARAKPCHRRHKSPERGLRLASLLRTTRHHIPAVSRRATSMHTPRMQEHVDAQLGLAKAYYRGDGVPQSYKEAALWLAKASGLGSEEATFQLDSLLQIKPGVAPLLGAVRVHGTSNKDVNGLEGRWAASVTLASRLMFPSSSLKTVKY